MRLLSQSESTLQEALGQRARLSCSAVRWMWSLPQASCTPEAALTLKDTREQEVDMVSRNARKANVKGYKGTGNKSDFLGRKSVFLHYYYCYYFYGVITERDIKELL